MTFIDLAYETLKKSNVPMTADEIWESAETYGFRDKVSSSGKTPERTLGAKIYVDIKIAGDQSRFIKVSNKPRQFGLRELIYSTAQQETKKVKIGDVKRYSERDLHPLLSTYVYSDSHFKCYTKTIYHEKSVKKHKGETEWLHPDIVGVYFPFDNYKNETIDLITSLNDSQCKLSSFEMKIKVEFSTLREYYFQAVSNSSWANEGYLVAFEFEDREGIDGRNA